MVDYELGRDDLGRLLPNAILSPLGITAHSLAVSAQENFYGRPNIWAGAMHKLQEVIGIRPDFMTSFTGPLIAMQILQMVCVMGQIQSEKFHKPKRESLFRLAKYLAPAAVALVFIGYEASGMHLNRAVYIDNPAADNVATLAALGVSTITALASEKIPWKKKV
jgi:hypothetical protein